MEYKTVSDIVFCIEADPDGGYTARALGYAIFTEADTWEELQDNLQDALRCHFEENKNVPAPH